MGKHAFLSASGTDAWSRCEAKPFREMNLPDKSSPAAIEGTCAHALLEECIKHGFKPESKLATAVFDENGKDIGIVSQEMCDGVQYTLDIIDKIPGEVYSEIALDISHVTGEKDAKGTLDVGIVDRPGKTIYILDLKFGYKPVEALDNRQMLTYASAALEEFDLVGDIEKVVLIISQPRLNNTSVWETTADEIAKFVAEIRPKGLHILRTIEAGKGPTLEAIPGEKQCTFCKVAATCPERTGFHVATITDDFVNLNDENDFMNKIKNSELRLRSSDDRHLATLAEAVPLIENWCKAVVQEMEERVQNGTFTDPRYKQVMGRGGNRKIASHEELVKLAESYFIKEMDLCDVSFLSVAQLEKIHKGTPFWKDAQRLIKRGEARPVVVHYSDKREAIDVVSDFSKIPVEDTEAKLGLSIENKT